MKGSGQKGLLCFHGFEGDATDFTSLNLGLDVKIISINLPYHSNSNFEEGENDKTLWKDDLVNIVIEILEREDIKSVAASGYSLGGKAVLTLLESLKLEIESAVLFAPDGFKENSWYWFASQTKIGEFLNKQSINNPIVFNVFVSLSRVFSLASNRQLNFAKQQMNSRVKRELVYNIWKAHRKLNTDLNLVRLNINKNKIPVKIVLGRFDKIIPSKSIKKWSQSSSYISLIEASCGHKIPKENLELHLIESLFNNRGRL